MNATRTTGLNSHAMALQSILRQQLIWPDLSARTKQEAVRELAHLIAGADPRLDAAEIETVLEKREQLGSTGLESGIAIPHGVLPKLTSPLLAFARSTAGVDFDSHDGGKTHLFFVLLAPEEGGYVHLRLLARLAALLKEKHVRDELIAAKDRVEIYHLIATEEERM